MRFKSNHDKVCLQQKNSCKHASDSQIFPQNKLFCFPKTEEFTQNRVVPLSTKQTYLIVAQVRVLGIFIW